MRNGVEFYFEGMAAGVFLEDAPPVNAGSFVYQPIRGPGHADMAKALSNSGAATCYYDKAEGRLFFQVTAIGEGHLLSLTHFELVRLAQSHDVEWLDPWVPAVPGLEKELQKEVGQGHVLFGCLCRSVARRIDRDDVLFAFEGQDPRVVVVRLTWSGKTEADSQVPRTEWFRDRAEWVEKKMKKDHQEFMET